MTRKKKPAIFAKLCSLFALLALLAPAQPAFGQDVEADLAKLAAQAPAAPARNADAAERDKAIVRQSGELGEIASAAALCGMDDQDLVARQVGIQFSAWLWGASGPEPIVESLLAFQGSADSFRQSYDKSSEPGKSGQCALAWYGWRAMRSASPMASASSDLSETLDLAGETGSVHGWAWACRQKGALDATIGASIAQQASSALLFAALSSKSYEDLFKAQKSWAFNYEKSRIDPRLGDTDCADIEKSLPVLAEAFEKKANVATSLEAAKNKRTKALGKAI